MFVQRLWCIGRPQTLMPIVGIGISAILLSPHAIAQQAPVETTQQKFSYGIGLNLARQMAQQGITDLDGQALARGVIDGLKGNDLAVSVEEIRAAFQAIQAEREKARTEAGTEAAAKGAAFLEQNKSAEGVQLLDGGVQYRVLKEGDGEMPKADDEVLVHYRGTLLDGTEFDSSYKRGEPLTLSLGGVIAGWRTALLNMKKGAKWQVWIPSDLAYGANGAGKNIGPNETLYFEIELLGVGGS